MDDLKLRTPSRQTSTSSLSPPSGANHLIAVQNAAKLVISQARRKSETKPDSPEEIPTDQIKNLDLLDLPNYHQSPSASDSKKNSAGDGNDKEPVGQTDNISQKERNRINRFSNLMMIPNLEIAILRKAAWSGIPNCYRGDTWRLLCGYMPRASRTTIGRKFWQREI